MDHFFSKNFESKMLGLAETVLEDDPKTVLVYRIFEVASDAPKYDWLCYYKIQKRLLDCLKQKRNFKNYCEKIKLKNFTNFMELIQFQNSKNGSKKPIMALTTLLFSIIESMILFL